MILNLTHYVHKLNKTFVLKILECFVWSVCRRKEILHMMTLTKVKDPKGAHFADYKKLRTYMKQEAYWLHMFNDACIQIAKFEVEGPQMPKTFEVYFKSQRKIHVMHAYSHMLGNMKSASDGITLPELPLSSKRLVYR